MTHVIYWGTCHPYPPGVVTYGEGYGKDQRVGATEVPPRGGRTQYQPEVFGLLRMLYSEAEIFF